MFYIFFSLYAHQSKFLVGVNLLGNKKLLILILRIAVGRTGAVLSPMAVALTRQRKCSNPEVIDGVSRVGDL